MLFKELSDDEKASYREWARINYEPLTEIKGIWHPVVQAECAKINELHGLGIDYLKAMADRIS